MNLFELVKNSGKAVAKCKGEYLFQMGDENSSLFLLKSGTLKAYYVSQDGKEKIKSFYFSGEMIGSIQSVAGDGKSSFNLVCVTDCELVAVDLANVKELCSKNLEVANQVIDFLLKFAIKKEKREFELLCLSPEERYERLLASSPELLEHIPQQEIALFLGVTPVGLSRIKNRIA